VPPTFKDPSERSKSATWEAVELRRVRIRVAAPVMSIVLSPPAQVKVAVLIVKVSVVASPMVVFPSTDRSPTTLVVPVVVVPVNTRLLPYMSPSASMSNTTDPPTANPRRFESAVADAGFM